MTAIVEYFHICNHAFLNDRQQPCLIGILNRLQAQSFPYVRASVSLAAQIHGEIGTSYKLTFELGPIDGPYLRRAPLTFDPSPFGFSTFLSIQMVQIFFPKPGPYEARIIFNDRALATAGLQIVGPNQQPLPPRAGLEVKHSPD